MGTKRKVFICKDCANRKELYISSVRIIPFWEVGTMLKCECCGDKCNPQVMYEIVNQI